jgi:hypothetical protein
MRRMFGRGAGGHGIVVAWPGFQMTPTGSRVFLAVTRMPEVSTRQNGARWVIHLQGASVPVRNNRRTLETEAFDTPVERITARNVSGGVDVVLDLRAPASPSVSRQTAVEGSLAYIFIDLPHWTRLGQTNDLRTPTAHTPASASPGASSSPAPTNTPAQRPGFDDEVPPAIVP